MEQAAGCRVLAVMGSGETSPTMVTTHKALAARLPAGRRTAVLLEAPYGFQQNAAAVSARAQAYFARSVGLTVVVLAAPAGWGSEDPAGDGGAAAVRAADWVFAGPGSPSYALARWRGSPVTAALRDRIAAGEGVTVLASAAAATMGFAAVPVYEIYKAGAAPHWLDGLDLLGILGLKVAVIPHYDNAEGRSHDTRYCYLGERRLSLLERELPADAAVPGCAAGGPAAYPDRDRQCGGRQLNKGENVHALKRSLAYAGEGALRHRHHEEQAEQMWCLTFATNAVVTWTTEYHGLAVTALRRAGRDIDDAVLAHIWPTHHENVHFYGTHSVDVDGELAKLGSDGYRPLRAPGSVEIGG